MCTSSYKQYFESDDKDLFRSKIKYIQENDPEDLGVVFAEEEYDKQGHVERVSLIVLPKRLA